MEPLEPPPTFKVYTVIKQTGLTMNYVYSGVSSTINFGAGFYGTRHEAEQARTYELLKDSTDPKPRYHVFELEVPNPACQE
jgi:hypothetical protein